jgi:ankyrin repeat protein
LHDLEIDTADAPAEPWVRRVPMQERAFPGSSSPGRIEIANMPNEPETAIEDLAQTRPDAGFAALCDAVLAGEIGLAEELLAAGTPPSPAEAGQGCPLAAAARLDRPGMVELLLSAGADPDGPHFDVPLHAAVTARSVRIARRLLEAGADANRPIVNGARPLHAAALHGDLKLAGLLLRHGAVDAPAHDGATADQLAKRAGHSALSAMIRAAAG